MAWGVTQHAMASVDLLGFVDVVKEAHPVLHSRPVIRLRGRTWRSWWWLVR